MLELIESSEGLAALESEWRALCERSATSVFQRPEWLLPWWKHLGGGEVCSLAAREGGRLRGIAPLFRHGMPGETVRQISFIGAGVTDYLDFIAEPGFEGRFASAVREWFDARREQWDVVNLEELRPGAVALAFGDAQPCSTCAAIDLPESVERWEASLDKMHRRNVRHARSHGDFRYELNREAAHFSDFIRLHELSWRDREQEGVVNTPELHGFYCEAARALSAAGLLRMHLLWRGDSLAGAIFGMEYKGCGYAYLGGFDPELRKSSPGTVLMWHAIADAITRGVRKWDLLRGEEPYKYIWGAKNEQNQKIRIGNS